MNYCQERNEYVTNLRLTVDKRTVACPSNAIGYWQANAMPSVQGVECDEELHKWHGIGYVDGDTVRVVWAARDPRTFNVVWWEDERPAEGQAQIIWTRTVIPVSDEPLLIVDSGRIKNMKSYTKAIEEADGI
jgi:hypothetical protein